MKMSDSLARQVNKMLIEW